jgi:hypothetical protein
LTAQPNKRDSVRFFAKIFYAKPEAEQRRAEQRQRQTERKDPTLKQIPKSLGRADTSRTDSEHSNGLDNGEIFQFVSPSEHYGRLIDFLEVKLNSRLKFGGRDDSHTAQQGLRHVAEERLDQVEPGTVFAGERELKRGRAKSRETPAFIWKCTSSDCRALAGCGRLLLSDELTVEYRQKSPQRRSLSTTKKKDGTSQNR